MIDNPGIQACMRLNARLHKRIDILHSALEFLAGPKDSCGGAMEFDEHGQPFSPEMLATMRKLHAKNCVRCVARKALDDCSDLKVPEGFHATLPVGADPRDLVARLLEAEASEQQLSRIAGEYERRYMAVLGPELLKRREEQDARHGGPAHDDLHTRGDWTAMIAHWNNKATDVDLDTVGEGEYETAVLFESRMLDVAALAISALLSSRRIHKQFKAVDAMDPRIPDGENGA